VGLFEAGSKVSQLQASFALTAKALRDDFFFGISTDPAVLKAAGVEKEAVVAFKAYDDKRVAYSGSTKSKDLQDWLQLQSLPIVGEWSNTRSERILKRKLPVAKFFMKIDWRPANVKHTQYFVNRIEPVARENLGKIIFTIANVSDFVSVMDEYGWKGKENGLVLENGRVKYRFDKAFKTENIRKWVSDYFEGKLEQWIKSEEVPGTNDGPVKVLVGKNFNEIVEPDSDVLIEFYAPWCGHCKTLEPKYKKLGQKFKGVDGLVIAKMDATANDYPPEYQVSGFPTIYFKPAGGTPIKYDGEREVDDMARFIKKNAKNPTKPSKRK